MAPNEAAMVKVELSNAHGDKETLWATPLGDDLYRLENSPFYAYNVSWQDIIEAQADGDGWLVFVRVVEKSGHRTVRIVLEASNDDATSDILAALVALGCTYEGVSARYFSLNAPPQTDFSKACDYLMENEIEWEYADPSYDTLHPEG